MRRAIWNSMAALALAAPGSAGHAQRTTTLDTMRVMVSSRAASSLVSAGRTVDVITREELDRRAGQPLSQVLATSLGVDISPRSPAQADIAIRGSSIEQVLILVDGIRVSDQQAGHFDLDLAVPMDMIERIEILRGTGSALYGPNAVGGVVNIITRRDRTLSLSRLKEGSFGTRGVALVDADTAGRATMQAGGDFERSDGQRVGTDYRITTGRVAFQDKVAGGTFAADAAVGVRDFGADSFYGPYPSFESTHATTATVRYDTPANKRWTFSVNASERRHTDLFTLERDDPSFYQNHHDNWQTGGEAVSRVAAAPGVALAMGAEAFDARLVSARLGDHAETRSAAFGEATLGTFRSATLDLGMRGDHSSEYGDFASPSVAATVPLASALQLRASAGRGFRAPTWTERFYVDPANVGTPDLKPERFSAAELGFRATPDKSTRLDVAAFWRHADDLIDWTMPVDAAPGTVWRTMNVESAVYRGIEMTAQLLHAMGADWTLRASGLSFSPEGATGFVGKYALSPITRTIGGTAAVPLSEHLQLTTDVLDARRAGQNGHTQVDARFAYRVRASRITLDLTNLTSVRYLDVSGMPVAGRAVYAGVTWVAR
jgi:outer membrane cobalamin receptor